MSTTRTMTLLMTMTRTMTLSMTMTRTMMKFQTALEMQAASAEGVWLVLDDGELCPVTETCPGSVVGKEKVRAWDAAAGDGREA